MDQNRRNVLATGVAATAMAAVPSALAQQAAQGGTFDERGPVRLRYEEAGSGFPLLAIAGGGLSDLSGRSANACRGLCRLTDGRGHADTRRGDVQSATNG